MTKTLHSTQQQTTFHRPTEQLIEIQERIKQQIQDIEDRLKVDIAIKIRERQIKSHATNKLRNEALRSGQKNKKLFYSSQIEWEQKPFIEAFMKRDKIISTVNASDQEWFQSGAI